MERISAFTDLCTASGQFRYGTQAGGVPPTPVKAEWLNLIQEELCNFILAYLPALDGVDNTQLLKAVRQLILNYYTKPETDELLLLKAPVNSPKLTGAPEAPTPPVGANTKQIANAAFVQAAIAALVDSSPGTLDTLREIAIALGDDPHFATTMTNILSTKAAKATSLAGYGIEDAYTEVQVDELLSHKQDKNTALMAVNGWRLDHATGLLEQWGQAGVGADGVSGPMDFPTPFGEVYNCFGNKVTPNATDGDGNSAGAYAISNTQFRLFNDTVNFGATVHWRAIGRAPGF
jgi:phage-related tail fiber protein